MNDCVGRLVIGRGRRALAGRSADDAGMTLIEIVVAIAIVTVAVLGLLAGLAADITQQHTEKLQTNAVRLATSALESAQALGFDNLAQNTGTTTIHKSVEGTDYTQVEQVQLCTATDAPTTCTTPAATAPQTARTTVTVTWSMNDQPRSVTMSRNISYTGTSNAGTGDTPLGSCGGSGTTLVSGRLSLSPSTVAVDSNGNPTQAVTATLTETGLSNATCVPLTWSDDTGAHQLSMTGSNGTYTVTVPKSSITKSTGTDSGTVSFTATVPGTQAVPSATLSIQGRPAFSGNCKITVVGLPLSTISLVPLTRNTLLATGLSCTTTNLSKTDSVVAQFASGSGGATKRVTLTSTDGTTWTGSIAAGTAMVSSGTSEAFTFTLTRASDGASASINQTATLA